MRIYDSEQELFSIWKVTRDNFVCDGVVSEPDYLSSTPKIAFILKEVNEFYDDLRKYVLEGGRPQTWNNVSRWVHGLRNLENIPPWDFYKSITPDFRVEILKSICVINLKKSPGIHTTNLASLASVANEDKGFFSRQYSFYDPDLTICGGTGDVFKKSAGHTQEWKITKRGIYWYERERNKYVIAFSHPEARIQDSLLLYGLLDAVCEIYGNRFL